MQSFEQIRAQVGAWSRENFGDQETPFLKVYEAGNIGPNKRDKADTPGPEWQGVNPLVAGLGGLAPLLGIAEEVGELAGANTKADAKDAVGDIAIYTCDYLTREGVAWPDKEVPKQSFVDPLTGLVAFLGQLNHCHLKRLQRIRGFHDKEHFEAKRLEALRGFLWHLELAAQEATNSNLLIVLNSTFHAIVEKRNWKKDAAAGGGHVHHTEEAGGSGMGTVPPTAASLGMTGGIDLAKPCTGQAVMRAVQIEPVIIDHPEQDGDGPEAVHPSRTERDKAARANADKGPNAYGAGGSA